MRVALPLTALLLTTGASAPQPVPVPPPQALVPWTAPVIGTEGSSPVCRDRIHEVRRELGQPELEQDASSGDPLLIAAVDKRVGGCSVLVMRDDTSDIRPLPKPREHRLMPAKPAQ